MYNNIVWKNPEQEGVLRHSKAFLLFTIQSHLFNSRQIARQISSGLIILKLFFGKKNMWKMEVLHIFGLWDQKIDSWFMNPDPLIPTLNPNCCCVLQCHQYHVAPTLLLRYNHQAYQTTWLGLQTVDILKQCAYILVPGVPDYQTLCPHSTNQL